MLDEIAIINCITSSMTSGQVLHYEQGLQDESDSVAQENLVVCDSQSDGSYEF